MLTASTNDPAAIALAALAATLGDERRAHRFLDLTGLDPDRLRAAALDGDVGLMSATLAFLEAHEPDLVAVAAAIDRPPAALIAALRSLEQ